MINENELKRIKEVFQENRPKNQFRFWADNDEVKCQEFIEGEWTGHIFIVDIRDYSLKLEGLK